MEKISWDNFKAKAAAFFDRNYAMVFAPIIAFVAYMVALISYGVYPFGDKYTAASYDLSAQICPFIEHLFDVMQGKSSLFYSYAIAGGADVLGTFLYFFISPFSFLFLIFGDGKVAYASGIVTAFKVAAIAVSGTWFAKKLFKDIPDYICIAIGLAYTYCGYAFVASTYINWMDFLIYVPFCVGAYIHYVKTDKFLPFAVLMACCIYTCFSIACFSMFTVFPIVTVYALLCAKKEIRNRFITRQCLAFVVAVLLALPVLLPALSAYIRSGRGGDGGLFENIWYGYRVTSAGELTSFKDSVFNDKLWDGLYAKWSYIISDSVFLLLTLVWFARNRLKDNFSKFMLVSGVMILLPTVVDEAMLLMNMGSYMSYALRFGFLSAVYFLGGACLAVEGFCYDEGAAYDGTPLRSINEGGRYALNDDKTSMYEVAMLALGAVALAFLLWFISNGNYKEIWLSFAKDSEGRKGLLSFSERYAHSLGGCEVVVVFLVVVAIVTCTGCLLAAKKKIGLRLLSYVLIAIVGAQTLFYNNQLVLGNRSQQHLEIEDYKRISATLNGTDDGYFRVKDYYDEMTSTATFTANANAFGVFSSVIDSDNFVIYNLFGYKGNGKNSLKSAHDQDKGNRSDEFGDSFLGYKYFLVPRSKKAEFEEKGGLRKYVKPFYVQNEHGERVHLSGENFYVYENDIVFPLGYTLPKGDFRFAVPNIASSANRKTNQAALYEFLRGKTLKETWLQAGSNTSEYVTPETARELSDHLWKNAAQVSVGAGKITAKVTAKKGECLFLNFVASKGYTVTVNGKPRALIDNDLKFLSVELDEGENEVTFTYSSPYAKAMLLGVVGAVVGLFVVALIVKKTKFLELASPVISWAGVLLATGVVAFFMLFPSVVWVVKLIAWIL